jgi:Domain of unknown function (DUF5615)
MVRFLADAGLNHAIVKGCRRREPAMDFLSAQEAKLEGVPDREVLSIAAEQNRILARSSTSNRRARFPTLGLEFRNGDYS